ncbi:glycosyltransferase [Arthrobacter rhombi]|uniref:glycosyltransferase n=1 Tax=Arthrobacter rhombi TaxID=71253 RepID=UPI003FD5D4FA
MPVRTVAEWGGLHEWVLHSVLDLQAIGCEVVVVGQDGVFRDRIESTGAEFVSLDWANWRIGMADVLSTGPWDKIFSHGPHARNVALRASETTGTPVYHMIHGAYLDQVNDWSPRVQTILAASPSIQDFVVRVGKVEPWKVAVVPNGVPDAVFDMPYRSLAEKISDGHGTVVTAARLAPDKVHQIEPTVQLVTTLSEYFPETMWTLNVMGDGPLRGHFENEFSRGLDKFDNVMVEYSGWVAPDEVPREMNKAVAACVAGMGGVRALAAGTLTVGVGAQGSVGLQKGDNLRAGIWSNFGDHGCPRFSPSDLRWDLQTVLANDEYDEIVQFARESCRLHRSEEIVRSALYEALNMRVTKTL